MYNMFLLAYMCEKPQSEKKEKGEVLSTKSRVSVSLTTIKLLSVYLWSINKPPEGMITNNELILLTSTALSVAWQWTMKIHY